MVLLRAPIMDALNETLSKYTAISVRLAWSNRGNSEARLPTRG